MGSFIAVRMGGVTQGATDAPGGCTGALEVTVMHPSEGLSVHSFARRRNNVANVDGCVNFDTVV